MPNNEKLLAKWKNLLVQLFNHSLIRKVTTIYSVERAPCTYVYSKNSRNNATSNLVD